MGICYSLDDLRGNHFAGTAPGGEAVEDDKGVFGFERLVPVGLSVLRSAR
jgi:hypothetical protein